MCPYCHGIILKFSENAPNCFICDEGTMKMVDPDSLIKDAFEESDKENYEQSHPSSERRY